MKIAPVLWPAWPPSGPSHGVGLPLPRGRPGAPRSLMGALPLFLEPVDNVAGYDDATGDNGAGGGDRPHPDEQRDTSLVRAPCKTPNLSNFEVHLARVNLALRIVNARGARHVHTSRKQCADPQSAALHTCRPLSLSEPLTVANGADPRQWRTSTVAVRFDTASRSCAIQQIFAWQGKSQDFSPGCAWQAPGPIRDA